jgi:hypothetical protein
MKVPDPPELLPGRPDAIIDLQTEEGAALAGGQWRYSDTRVRETGFVSVGPDLGPNGPANRTYEVVPRAHAADFDDSAWTILAPADTQLRLSTGRVCFNWYRITETIPERVGDLDPADCTVVFETSSTTTPRSGSTASCREPWARSAGRSWPVSTRPTGWC